MPRKIETLSNLQIGRIRANLSRRTTQIAERLKKNAEGTLRNPEGELIEMTAGQINSAALILKHVLPGQQATTFQDVTEPEQSKEQIEREYQQAIANLPVTDLKEVLRAMPKDERQALIDSMSETSQ